MTKATQAPVVAEPFPDIVPESRISFSAFWTLFRLQIRHFTRGKRLIVLSILFALPMLLAVVLRSAGSRETFQKYLNPDEQEYVPAKYQQRQQANVPAGRGHVVVVDGHLPAFIEYRREDGIEFWLIFMLIPITLLPLTALLYASGMIQDEIDDQTITYLLLRSLSRRQIYLAKLLATMLFTGVLIFVFTFLTYAATLWGVPNYASRLFSLRVLSVQVVLALAVMSYTAFFGMLPFITVRPLVIGFLYILLWEGIAANIEFQARAWTQTYYLRTLLGRMLEDTRFLYLANWRINLNVAPGAMRCLVTLLILSLLTTYFATRSF